MAYAWALTLGGEEGAQLLKKMGLLDHAIEYAVESGAFAQVGAGLLRWRRIVARLPLLCKLAGECWSTRTPMQSHAGASLAALLK